jgi:ketosteroid isomerase-like protein
LVEPRTPPTDVKRNLRAAEEVGVVRALWVAARDEDVDALVDLTAPDVDWSPTAAVTGSLHGQEALRAYLEDLIANGTLVAAHPYSFEAVGDCVIVSGTLRLRRQDGAPESVQRWWVYRVANGLIASVVSHASRDDGCRDARAQHAAAHVSD